MRNIELAYLIEEHTQYCIKTFVPGEIADMTFKEGLAHQEKMCNSLTHFSMWLRTIKGRKDEGNV